MYSLTAHCGNRTKSFDIFHLLGAERIEEDTETPDRERYFRKDVRYDASVQLIAAETVQNEYDGLGQQDDALPDEAERNRFFESLRSQALAQGVEFIACQMSMDMMGIQHEELLDEVTAGAALFYLYGARGQGECESIYMGGQDMETLCKNRDVYRNIAEFEVQFTQMYDLS